jgi:NitT/TauT family transport system permease protein
MPIIWQNLTDGYKSINQNLQELTVIYELGFFKRQKLLVIPTLMNYLIPAMLTSIGLAWKSGIAAEILTYSKNSIGKNIHDAKAYFEGPDLLCWTITVIFISLIFEYSIKFLIERFKKWRFAF